MDRDRGYFIVFEGIDKSGKGTQIELCKIGLENLGYSDIVVTSEPTDAEKGPIGIMIREVLRHKMKLPPLGFQVWYTADRHWHDPVIIKPALARKAIVLDDRYRNSTIAYGSAFGVDADLLAKINSEVTQPDLTLFIDVDIEEIANRLKMTATPEFFEKKEKLAKIAEAYKTIVTRYYPMTIVDGNGTIDEVHGRIMSHVLRLLGHDTHQKRFFEEARPFPETTQ